MIHNRKMATWFINYTPFRNNTPSCRMNSIWFTSALLRNVFVNQYNNHKHMNKVWAANDNSSIPL